jgi:hypothetical protein
LFLGKFLDVKQHAPGSPSANSLALLLYVFHMSDAQDYRAGGRRKLRFIINQATQCDIGADDVGDAAASGAPSPL